MRLLLVDIVRTSLGEVWPSVEHSLGLMYLASAVRQHFGGVVETRIATLVSRPDRLDEESAWALQLLADADPDVVGVRCLSIGKDSLEHLVRAIKAVLPECPVLVGGPYATDSPEEALRISGVDVVAIGEGERTIVELVERLMSRRPLTGVSGTAYLEHGIYRRAAPRPVIEDVDSLPLPAWDLVNLEEFSNRYLTFSSKIYQRHGNIMTTRGCPYRCMYCHNILGKGFRARSPASVLAEIRHLYDQYGITDFQVIDDIFNLDRRRAKLICDLIIDSRMKITLSFPNGVRGDLMDEELIDKLARAGTRFISYAIETASPRLQRLIRKNLKLDAVFRAIERTTRAGIITRGFFMLGFPSETEEEVESTIRFAQQSDLCGATFFTVVYFPGTELFRLAQELGYFRQGQAEVRRDYVQVADGPYEFSTQRLAELKRGAIRDFAFSESRIQRARALLPTYFAPREVDGFFMAYVVSSGIRRDEVQSELVRELLGRHFAVAERFSKRGEFYV
jgi:anaerobic magnesium-protoporphyrin IX monomethyl ester cyclase